MLRHLLQYINLIKFTDIDGGHWEIFKTKYNGDENKLDPIAKSALGTYTLIGIVKDGSPVYEYKFHQGNYIRNYYIFREFRPDINGAFDRKPEKIWKGVVMQFTFLKISGLIKMYTVIKYKFNLGTLGIYFKNFRLILHKMKDTL